MVSNDLYQLDFTSFSPVTGPGQQGLSLLVMVNHKRTKSPLFTLNHNTDLKPDDVPSEP